MTPDEARVVEFLLAENRPVPWQRLADQFGLSGSALGLRLDSLKRRLLLEQDGHWYRLREGAAEALGDFANHWQHIPFDTKRGWPAP